MERESSCKKGGKQNIYVFVELRNFKPHLMKVIKYKMIYT